MTKTIIDLKAGTITEEEYTSEELAQKKVDKDIGEAFDMEQKNAKHAKADLKASAKAKLIAGESLTEDEANTIVL